MRCSAVAVTLALMVTISGLGFAKPYIVTIGASAADTAVVNGHVQVTGEAIVEGKTVQRSGFVDVPAGQTAADTAKALAKALKDKGVVVEHTEGTNEIKLTETNTNGTAQGSVLGAPEEERKLPYSTIESEDRNPPEPVKKGGGLKPGKNVKGDGKVGFNLDVTKEGTTYTYTGETLFTAEETTDAIMDRLYASLAARTLPAGVAWIQHDHMPGIHSTVDIGYRLGISMNMTTGANGDVEMVIWDTVPEPSGLLTLGAGMLPLAGLALRRKRR